MEAARQLLRAMGLRKEGVEIVSCPTCGRTGFDLLPVVRRVEAALPKEGPYLKVAVMGCAVNGRGRPGTRTWGWPLPGTRGSCSNGGSCWATGPGRKPLGN